MGFPFASDSTPLTEKDLVSIIVDPPAKRAWAQQAIFGRVPGSPAWKDDAAFVTELRARLVAS